jgi:hypothetical protein
MSIRCRYSKEGLTRLGRQQRDGTLIRVQRGGACLVLWDGLKYPTPYHPDFIEVLGEDEPDLLEERVRPADELRIRRPTEDRT